MEMDDTCTKYLSNVSVSDRVKSELLAHKALSLGYWLDEHKSEHIDTEFDYTIRFNEMDSLFVAAANVYPPLRITHYCDAFSYFENKDEHDNSKFRDTLVKYGLKPSINALGFNLDYFTGKRQYVGGEFTVFLRQEFCKVGRKVGRKKVDPNYFFPYSCSVFNIGYRRSISDNAWGLNISPISMSLYWVNFRPFNFVYFNTQEGNMFAWCPEAGIHWWVFYFNYSYPIAFKKSLRSIEQGQFNCKIQIPLSKFH